MYKRQGQNHNHGGSRQLKGRRIKGHHEADAEEHTGNGARQNTQEIQQAVNAHLLLLHDVGQDHRQERSSQRSQEAIEMCIRDRYHTAQGKPD